MPRLNRPGMLLFTQHPHNPDQEQPYEPTAEEEAARHREEERQKVRKRRDNERIDRNNARDRAAYLSGVDMFWFCQMDIFRGYWATPWHDPSHVTLQTCLVGAVTVILEVLLGFLDDASLVYTGSHPGTHESFHGTTGWLSNGNCTYRAYAVNAHGGVIAGRVSRLGVQIPAFKTTAIPPLELLHSYEWQVDSSVRDQIRCSEEQNAELMRLDSWLSYVGRTSENADGANKLLKQTPALVSLLIAEFELDFKNINISASEGGLQDIQSLAANVMDFFTDEDLTEGNNHMYWSPCRGP